jgi:hypothetical protein
VVARGSDEVERSAVSLDGPALQHLATVAIDRPGTAPELTHIELTELIAA